MSTINAFWRKYGLLVQAAGYLVLFGMMVNNVLAFGARIERLEADNTITGKSLARIEADTKITREDVQQIRQFMENRR